MSIGEHQLTLDVRPHPRLGPGAFIAGSLKLAGDLSVDRDLNRGEQLMIQVSDADGNVLSTALAMVQGVGFSDVTDRGTVIGTERQHKARVA